MPQSYSCVPNGVPPTQHVNSTGAGTPVLSYVIGFPYISSTDIIVFTGDAGNWTQRAQGAGANQYQVNPKGGLATDSVVFNGAVSGTNILIWRRTDLCDMSREFQPGSSIRAQDLNQDFTQLLYLMQEAAAIVNNVLDGGDGGGGLPNPGDKIELDDLGDVDVAGATDRSYLAYDGSEWKDATVQKSTDTWTANDTDVATTAAIQAWGDDRYLNDANDVVGGDSITATEASNKVTLDIDLDTNGGLESTNAGNPAGQLKVKPYQGINVGPAGVEVVGKDGITVNSNGVYVDPHHGINVTSDGVSVKLNATNPGLAVDNDGLRTDGKQTNIGTVQFGSGATYQFPETDGSNGQVLTTDSSGTLSWSDTRR